MADQTINARLKLNAKTTAEWNLRPLFIPLLGEIIVYTDRATKTVEGTTVDIPGIKIGDGNAYLIDLPFVSDDYVQNLYSHTSNTTIHVTAEEKSKWNNKLNYSISGEELVFNRN